MQYPLPPNVQILQRTPVDHPHQTHISDAMPPLEDANTTMSPQTAASTEAAQERRKKNPTQLHIYAPSPINIAARPGAYYEQDSPDE